MRISSSLFIVVTLFGLEPFAHANTGHWRSVSVARIDTPTNGGICDNGLRDLAAKDDGAYYRYIACSNSYPCTTPTDLHFEVPDFADVQDASFAMDYMVSGPDARASIECVNSQGTTLASMVPSRLFSGPSKVYFDVPSACFTASDVTIRVRRQGGHCIAPDWIALNVKTSYRRVPVVAVEQPSGPPGSCSSSCINGFNDDDGNYLQWISCSSTYRYTTPTDFVYTVFDHGSVTDARLVMDAFGSGPNAVSRISCVAPNGSELGVVSTSYQFGQTKAYHQFTVPNACFAGPQVRIRVARTGVQLPGRRPDGPRGRIERARGSRRFHHRPRRQLRDHDRRLPRRAQPRRWSVSSVGGMQ